MMEWQIGQTVTCAVHQSKACITELYDTPSGPYATLYNPKKKFKLCGQISLLQKGGWQLITLADLPVADETFN